MCSFNSSYAGSPASLPTIAADFDATDNNCVHNLRIGRFLINFSTSMVVVSNVAEITEKKIATYPFRGTASTPLIIARTLFTYQCVVLLSR